MNASAQIAAIAKTLGWVKREGNTWFWDHRAYPRALYPPNYPSELEAMRNVEMGFIIPNGLWGNYVKHLKTTMRDGEIYWGVASSEQRAKAFLLMFDKWEGDSIDYSQVKEKLDKPQTQEESGLEDGETYHDYLKK